MSQPTPSSDIIIFALEALGFDVEDDNDEAAILSDGNYNLKIFYAPTPEQLEKIRDELSKVFSDYVIQVAELTDENNEDYDDNVSLIVDWL